jgi:Family of unknown function (DUF5996)
MAVQSPLASQLPALPLEAWEPAKETLHLYSQIVGKIQLASRPPRNHWWNATLRVDTRGVRSLRLFHGLSGQSFDILFDLIDHRLVVSAADGRTGSFALRDGVSVADFDRALHEQLASLGLDTDIRESPFGVPMTTPFPRDNEHASYNPEFTRRWWRVLDFSDRVFEEFAGWSCAKTSPVQLFWHSFDLAVTRFSGRRAPALDGADAVGREAYSHEVISFGFWAGDQQLREPAYYSYTAPEPDGLIDEPLAPSAATWAAAPTGGHLAFLPYDAVRTSDDPRRALLAFMQSAYEAGARRAGWDQDDLTSSFCPGPAALRELTGVAS